MSRRPESDVGKTGSGPGVFKRPRAALESARGRRFAARAAIVLGAGLLLFVVGVVVGRAGSSSGSSSSDRGSMPVVLVDAGAIVLLDASLRLDPIEGFDAAAPASTR